MTACSSHETQIARR